MMEQVIGKFPEEFVCNTFRYGCSVFDRQSYALKGLVESESDTFHQVGVRIILGLKQFWLQSSLM